MKGVCKDCVKEGVSTVRPTPHPGPRCTTHHRAAVKRRKARAHELRTEHLYGLTAEQYWKLYDYQGGRCWVCQRASGKVKRLAVDHDHHAGCDHPPEQGCIMCVRCLACGPCNQQLGRWGLGALHRAIEVYTDPPAHRVLRLGAENTLTPQ